jgi:hypothetical protein
MDFCIRYLPRTPALIGGNLTGLELQVLLTVGLSVMAVQHVALPGWQPSGTLGTEYGTYAAKYAGQVGLPPGINLWLDLEEVAAGTIAQAVIDYCKAWFTAVITAGFVPGIYVGWNVILSDEQLYDLPFAHYWRSYNCDQNIPIRGWQLIQKPQQILDGIMYDPNVCQADRLGGLPIWVSA